jgi:hypothetical protein
MPSSIHTPDWHLLDSAFPDANRGLTPPRRNLTTAGATLRIANLDRADPPGYKPGDYVRGPFNSNVFAITAEPCMPLIGVQCETAGFDPATTPIEWRLVCRNILCRHTNSAGYRYKGATETFDREWRGCSSTPTFGLFAPDCQCTYNGSGCVLGGHALLMVAVKVGGEALVDYVHLRIAGTNPGPPEVLRYLDGRLAGYDPNVASMVRAVFRHESNFRQFSAGVQSSSLMKFTRVHHNNPAQTDCPVRFDFPDDPAGFPLASFDFGVGISQWTEVGTQRVTADIAWDWRENIRLGANHLLGALARCLKPGITWQQAAKSAWTKYNGSGAAAVAYAARLAGSPDGKAITAAVVPQDLRQVALFEPPPVLAEPAPWSYS